MKPIQVDFKPSLIFTGIFAFASLAACLTLILMPFTWQIKLSLVLLVLILAIHTTLYHGLLYLPASIVGLRVNIKNELELLRKDGQNQQVMVLASTVVTPYLVVINYYQEKKTWRQIITNLFKPGVIILTDKTEAENLRQLRVWLRWAKLDKTNVV